MVEEILRHKEYMRAITATFARVSWCWAVEKLFRRNTLGGRNVLGARQRRKKNDEFATRGASARLPLPLLLSDLHHLGQWSIEIIRLGGGRIYFPTNQIETCLQLTHHEEIYLYSKCLQ